MNNEFIHARELLAKAREALRHGEKATARQLGEQAALLAPEVEDVWLVLAASDPDPRQALMHARKALQINPQSIRAGRGVEWAVGRLKQAQAQAEPHLPLPQAHEPLPPKVIPNQVEALTSLPNKRAYQTAVALPQLTSNGRNWFLPAMLTGAVFMFLGFIVLFAVTRPALASIVSNVSGLVPTQENLWAPAEIAKPEVTPIGASAFAVQDANTPTAVPTEVPPTTTPEPTEAPTIIPAATATPASLVMERVEDTPTSEYTPPTNADRDEPVASGGNGGRWIDVNLSQQMVYAYEGDTVVNSFVVSTGVAGTPTVTGRYKIYVKNRMQDMSGPGYYLRDVPWVMFFYGDYGLHGTYWHNNFGVPMSRGCVNLTIDDAAWLFSWASVGTVVNVHY